MKGAFMCRVLVPTDFSEAALRVTREAMSWVDAVGGDVLLLHVVPDMYLGWLDHLAMTFIDQTRLEAAYEELREQGQQELSTWLPSAVQERCRTLVAVGDLADTILKVAQEEMADVIIMRAPKRRWWRPILAGSLTDTVRRRASIPVVVWDGLETTASSAMWPDAQRPQERDSRPKGRWRDRRRARMEHTDVLKSW
ncbi:MAG TPA: universal stress protein [Candidatus Tectomicrobia bacterium]